MQTKWNEEFKLKRQSAGYPEKYDVWNQTVGVGRMRTAGCSVRLLPPSLIDRQGNQVVGVFFYNQ